jgi:(E)-4-hydroxy-3-methylbut-2-enyl-diphosphate synthase
MTADYTIDRYVTRRRSTRVVRIGDVAVGGDNPIRIQSMTNTDTMDTRATVDQIERLAAAGCEIARVTAPSIRDAENLEVIKSELRRRKVGIPLVADIHFTPNAAMIAANFVEKVRINPGNYADKKKFEVREYSDGEYAQEIERVAAKFRPLVLRCKENGVAMRIGTNHGSLSDRIMNRFGDSPGGMVESALEFLDVCEDEGFRDIVFSMKASNTHVAIQAYRLLAKRLGARAPEEPGYPFHLGVTEAGDAEDGRIKSAMGIGALLEDGIGDTIRVSLTEDPVREVPVAEAIARRAERREAEDRGAPLFDYASSSDRDPYSHARRETAQLPYSGFDIGGEEPVRVEFDLGALQQSIAGSVCAEAAEAIAAAVSKAMDSLAIRGEIECEGLALAASSEDEWTAVAPLVSALAEAGVRLPLALQLPIDWRRFGDTLPGGLSRVVLKVAPEDDVSEAKAAISAVLDAGLLLECRLEAPHAVLPALATRLVADAGAPGRDRLLFSIDSSRAAHCTRLLEQSLANVGAPRAPVVLRYTRPTDANDLSSLIDASIDLGLPLIDGIGDAVSIAGFEDLAGAVDLAYRVLQGARLRTTRTEYISCPSCGRTLFDLEETTAKIKSITGHLSGVKIGIMGCIVNGPGEMADADFGYVGSGPGVVTLYVGQQVVARGIPEAKAPERLAALIKEHGL